MSDTDSFIEEVTEEVRRDRLFGLFRKYGWIGIAVVLVTVGGTAYNEWSKAQARAQAQAAGDAILNALDADEADGRVSALQGLEGDDFTSGAQAVIALLLASELSADDKDGEAQDALEQIAADTELPEIYRQIALLKASSRQGNLSVQERRDNLSGLAVPGAPLSQLAQEQLALLDLENGEVDAAVSKLQDLVVGAETTAGLRQRASQLIIALGGEPEGSADQ